MEYSVEDSAQNDLAEEEEKIDEIYKQQSILSFFKGNSKKPKARNDKSFQEKDQAARCIVEKEPKLVSEEKFKIIKETEQKKLIGEVESLVLNKRASKKIAGASNDFKKNNNINSVSNTEESTDDLKFSCEENQSENEHFAPRRRLRKKAKQIVSDTSESSDLELDVVKRRKRKKKTKRIKKDVDLSVNESNRKGDSDSIKSINDDDKSSGNFDNDIASHGKGLTKADIVEEKVSECPGSIEQAKCDKDKNKRHNIFSDPKICHSNEKKVIDMQIDDAALNSNEEKLVPSLGNKGIGSEHITGIRYTKSTKTQNTAKLDVKKHPTTKESTITFTSKVASFPLLSHVLQRTANEQQWYDSVCKSLTGHNYSLVDSSTKASYFGIETKSFCRSLLCLEKVLPRKKESCIQERSLLECISDIQMANPDYLICKMFQSYLNCQKNILKQCVLKAEQSKSNMKIIWEKQEKLKTIITVSSSPEKTPQAIKEPKIDIRTLFGRSRKTRDTCRQKDHFEQDVVEVSKVSEIIDIKGSKEENSSINNSRKGKKKNEKKSKSKDHIEIEDTCVKSEKRRTGIEELFKNASKKSRRRNMKEGVMSIQDQTSINKENSTDIESKKKEERRSSKKRNKQKECNTSGQETQNEIRHIELVSSEADEERIDVEIKETNNEDKEIAKHEKKNKKQKACIGNGNLTLSVSEDEGDSKPRNKKAKKKSKDSNVNRGLEESTSFGAIEDDEKQRRRENEERPKVEDKNDAPEVTSYFIADEERNSRAKKKKNKKSKASSSNEDVEMASSCSAGEDDENVDNGEEERKPRKGDSKGDVEEAQFRIVDESETCHRKKKKKKSKARNRNEDVELLLSHKESEDDKKHKRREEEPKVEDDKEDQQEALSVSADESEISLKTRKKKRHSKASRKDVEITSTYSGDKDCTKNEMKEEKKQRETGDTEEVLEEASCFVADEKEVSHKKKKKKNKSKASSSSDNVEMASSCSTDESNTNSEKQTTKEESTANDCREDREIAMSNSADEGDQRQKKKKKKKKLKKFDSNEDLANDKTVTNEPSRISDSNGDHEVVLSFSADEEEKLHKKNNKKTNLGTSDIVEDSGVTSLYSGDEADQRRKSLRNSKKKKPENRGTKSKHGKEEESSLDMVEHDDIRDNDIASDFPKKKKKRKSKKKDKTQCTTDENHSGKKNTSSNEKTDNSPTIDIRTLFNSKKKSKVRNSLDQKVEEKGVTEVALGPEQSVDHKAIKYVEKPSDGIIIKEEKPDIPIIEISTDAEKQSSEAESANLPQTPKNIKPHANNGNEQNECTEIDNLKTSTAQTDENNQGYKGKGNIQAVCNVDIDSTVDDKQNINAIIVPVEMKIDEDIGNSLEKTPKIHETSQSRSILSFFNPVGQRTRQKKIKTEAVSAPECEMQTVVNLSEQVKKEITAEGVKSQLDLEESIKIKEDGDDITSLDEKKTDTSEDSGTIDMNVARCGNKRKRALQIACNDLSVENPALSSSVSQSKRKKLDLNCVSESCGHEKQHDVKTEVFTKLKYEKVCQPKSDSDDDDPVMEIHRNNMSDCMLPNNNIPLDKSLEKVECDNEGRSPESNNGVSKSEPVAKTADACAAWASDAQRCLQVTETKSDLPLSKEEENKNLVKVDVSDSVAEISGRKDATISCPKEVEVAELSSFAGSKVNEDLHSTKGAKRKRHKSSNDVVDNMDNCERRRSKRVKDKQEKIKETPIHFDANGSAGLSPKKKKTKKTRELSETKDSLAGETKQVTTVDISSEDCSVNEKSAPESTVVVADNFPTNPSRKMIEEEPVTEESVNRSLQWTDKYSPIKHDDVIGNKKAVEELFFWLSSWKEKHEHFVHLMSVNAAKNSRSRSKTMAESDSDDDFYDSSEEEEDLLNTFIIIGKTGCGSTAAVYACAQELGYKVLELNPSIYRTGKQIQSLLGEATQSHQVKRKFHASNNDAVDSTADDLKGMKSLSSFFGGKSGKGNNDKSEPKIENEEKEIDEPRCKENLTASRAMDDMSVILLEQADLLFDDLDKGFWLGVNELRSQTKRPIVITANNSSVASQLDSNAEMIEMDYPTKAETLVHLQVMCLAEHVFPSKKLLNQIITSSNCDIRQSIMQLEFLLEHWKDPMCKITISDEISKLNSQDKQSKGNAESCCEIQVVDETRPIEDQIDENMLTKEEAIDVQDQCLGTSASKIESCDADHCKRNLSENNGIETNVNTNISCNTAVDDDDMKQSSELNQSINLKDGHKSDENKAVPSHEREISQNVFDDKKNKLMIDVLDADDVRLDQRKSCSFDIEKIGMQQAIQKKSLAASYYVPVTKRKHSADRGNGQISEIELISASYDDLSHIDTYGRSKDISDSFGWWSSKLKDGLADSLPMNVTDKNFDDLDKWHAELHLVCRKLQQSSMQKIGVKEETPIILHNKNEIYNVLGSAEECLPLTTRLDHRATTVDVIPSLKSICLMEENRKLTQFKRRTRRFLHYLDGLLLQLDSDLHQKLLELCLT